MHRLEANDNDGDVEDMWLSLKAMGYNDNGTMDEVRIVVKYRHL